MNWSNALLGGPTFGGRQAAGNGSGGIAYPDPSVTPVHMADRTSSVCSLRCIQVVQSLAELLWIHNRR